MEPHFYSTTDKDKKARYEEFLTQYAGLIENERDETSVMANTAAALREAFGFFGTPVRIAVRERSEKDTKKN